MTLQPFRRHVRSPGHQGAAAEPALAAWGIDTDGKPVFVGLEAASSESGDAWEGFLRGLGERGLRARCW